MMPLRVDDYTFRFRFMPAFRLLIISIRRHDADIDV